MARSCEIGSQFEHGTYDTVMCKFCEKDVLYNISRFQISAVEIQHYFVSLQLGIMIISK